MSRHLGLRTRIRRLEKRRSSRRPRPAIVFAIEGESLNRVVALGGWGTEPVSRLWGEDLASLAQRARTAVGAPRVLLASYPAPAPVIASVAAPPAPEAPPAPKFDRAAASWQDWRQQQGI